MNNIELRDHFAGQALQGELSQQDDNLSWFMREEELTERCYKIADAMMKARELNKPQLKEL